MSKNSKKYKIGISSRIVKAENYNETRDALSHDWILLLEELDLIPIQIPNKLKNLDNFLKEIQLDGIILSGGDNIGENKDRDLTETRLLTYSMEKKLPLIGICRGMQLINDYFGGILTLDTSNNHVNQYHELNITDKNFSSLFSNQKINVNSYHKNLILSDKLGEKLTPFAMNNSDNTIEGFYHNTLPIFGVMWHPERNPNNDSKLLISKLFKKEENSEII